MSQSKFTVSYVEDCQTPIKELMPLDSDAFEVSGTVPSFVPTTYVLAEPNVVAHAAARKEPAKAKKDGRGTP